MKIYLVGGAVRNKLLEHKITHDAMDEKDWVVVGSTPEEMLSKGFVSVGKSFPVFLHPETHEEYALARTEKKMGKGYTGFVFYTSPSITLEEDLARRDLTINAMAMSPDGRIIDPYQGQRDLSLKVLRHVSDAFCEDPVRILRVARFMARYGHIGFTIAEETLRLMKKMVQQGEVDALVPDRVWQETQRALAEHSPEKFFQTLSRCNALEILYPEISTQVEKIAPLLIFKQSECNFAAMTLPLSSIDINNLCKKYPIPTEYRQLGQMANQSQQCFRQPFLSSNDILDLLERSDAYRQPTRFEKLVCLFEQIYQNNTSEKLKKALKLTQVVKSEPLIQQGYKGKSLGEQIKKERLKRLIECFGE